MHHRNHSTCSAQPLGIHTLNFCRAARWRNRCVDDSRRSQSAWRARREIKLGAHQTKGAKGRTVVLSNRVRQEITDYLLTMPRRQGEAPLIASQRNGRAFTNVSLSMLFREIYEMAGLRTSSHSGRRTFAARLNARGVGMKTSQKYLKFQHQPMCVN